MNRSSSLLGRAHVLAWLAVLAAVACSRADAPGPPEETSAPSRRSSGALAVDSGTRRAGTEAASSAGAAAPAVSSAPVADAALGSTRTSDYLGTWRIERFEPPARTAGLAPERASAQVGKAVVLRERAAQFDAEFLWIDNPSCTSASYSWWTTEELSGHAEQALLPKTHADKRPGDPLVLGLRCSGVLTLSAEVTRRGELAVHYDGFRFFLKPAARSTQQ